MTTVKRFAISLSGKFLAEDESLQDSPFHGLLFADIDCAALAFKNWCQDFTADWKIIEVEIPVYQ